MPDIKTTLVEIPANVVDRKPNPYQPVVDALVASPGKALAFEMPSKTDNDAKAIESAVGHIQRAARTVDKSARKKVTKSGDTATVTVWLVDKISRERTTSA